MPECCVRATTGRAAVSNMLDADACCHVSCMSVDIVIPSVMLLDEFNERVVDAYLVLRT